MRFLGRSIMIRITAPIAIRMAMPQALNGPTQTPHFRSCRLSASFWIADHTELVAISPFTRTYFALSVQAARNQSVRGKLGRRLMRLTMDDQSCAEENHERSQAPGLAPEQEGCG